MKVSAPQLDYETRPKPARSFTANAVLIGVLTFASRILGLARESVAAGAYGDNPIWSAFVFAFTIPNLFRKLFGEGALSAAFIPLYAQAVKAEEKSDGTMGRSDGATKRRNDEGLENKALDQDASTSPSSPSSLRRSVASSLPPPASSLPTPAPPSSSLPLSSHDFALASVNLLCFILLSLTVVGELCLLAAYFLVDRPDYLLAIRLTAIMLPYVLLICGSAFLGAILQVHHRFAAVTATSIVLNAVLIAAILLGAKVFDFSSEGGQTQGTYLLSLAVLVSGVIQVAMLWPSLRAVGFRFRLIFHVLTPQVRKMLWLTLPVALSAGVLQVGVMLDKAISFALAKYPGHEVLNLGFTTLPMPMAEGAAVRLNWAQYLYQFPLGVFAIALATAIFPTLAQGALDADKSAFRAVLRRGITASLFIGLPASVGMVVVADSAVRLMFQHGRFTAESAALTILSTKIYSAAIWAFSLQQILNRAYYALHDTKTPLIWGIVNLVINLVVEIPLLWTPLGESAMAVGTLVSFAVQSLVMTWALSRRLGGLGLWAEVKPLAVMTLASLAMGLMCDIVTRVPGLPTAPNKLTWATLLGLQMLTGIAVYAGLCQLGGVNVLSFLRRRRRHRPEAL